MKKVKEKLMAKLRFVFVKKCLDIKQLGGGGWSGCKKLQPIVYQTIVCNTVIKALHCIESIIIYLHGSLNILE